jgi:hypothetical protein
VTAPVRLEPEALLAALRARSAKPFSIELARFLAERLVSHAVPLRLVTADDALAVLELWLLLSEANPGSSLVEGVVTTVLTNVRWPVRRRVAFLARHLVGRSIDRDTDEVAAMLFGV